jgi:Family of unknown function (DUF5694)
MMKKFLLLLIILAFSSNTNAQSNTNQGQNKPAIAFLGTFHFKGSSDMMSLKTDDLSSPKKQNEIEELINALVKYKPTKIILEYPYGNNKIDSVYQLYLNETHTLTINERQQIGFRVAAKMGHKNVYPADYRLDLPFDSLMTFLQENKQMGLFQNMMSDMKTQVIDVWQKAYNDLTIKEFFVFLNNDTYDALNRNVYLEYINKMGSVSNYEGSVVVSKWWERNFKIMYNIDSIIEPDDRVLVLFGQGHTAILKDFYKTRSDILYTDILTYLKK